MSLHTDSLTQLIQDWSSKTNSFSREASSSVAEMRQNEDRSFKNEKFLIETVENLHLSITLVHTGMTLHKVWNRAKSLKFLSLEREEEKRKEL